MKKLSDVIVVFVGLFFCYLFIGSFIPSIFFWGPMGGFFLIPLFMFFILPLSVIAIVIQIADSIKKRREGTSGTFQPQTLHRLSTKEKIIVFIAIFIIAYCVYRYVPWAN